MKAEILTLKTLFQKEVRYQIPTFQRPYVWSQDEQWEPLWDDVRNVAERYLDEWERLGPDGQVQAEMNADRHFLGAIVVQQQPTLAAEIETRTVIDGQQRLTTLQLLLDATQEVCERLGCTDEARRLSRLVLNDEDFVGNHPDHVFKIWPTTVDQAAFRQAMHNDQTVDDYSDSRIVQAHEFFQLQVQQWLEEDGTQKYKRAQGLETALITLLQMVVIDLEHQDDEHVIFETLNARGTPLLASDLIKNYVLMSAAEREQDEDGLYSEYWQGFDDEWWRHEVRQGRIVRPRVDVFLNYWLVLKTADEVKTSNVFPAFKTYMEDSATSVKSISAELRQLGATFQALDANDGAPQVAMFLYRWKVMDAGVITPVLLWLFSKAPMDLSQDRFERSLRALESYLIRRMVCRMTTKDYNRLFLDLISELNTSDPSNADEAVVKFLEEQDAESRFWPDDERVKADFLNLPVYRLLTRGRIRLVLEGIEDALRTPKAEKEQAPRNLTIEHVMPQQWRDHWPLDAITDEEYEVAARDRDRLIHTIGNLTLVNGSLNPALSNSDWDAKRHGLSEHSVLYLNKSLLDNAPERWSEQEIAARGKFLFEKFASVWPSPNRV